MPIIEPSAVRALLEACPVVAFPEGELILRQGTVGERMLFLNEGAVDIVRDEVMLARITEPGAVLGDMAAILGRPHSADERAAAPSRCHVIDDAARLLRVEPALALFVVTVLASRWMHQRPAHRGARPPRRRRPPARLSVGNARESRPRHARRRHPDVTGALGAPLRATP